jgi:pimeloyl-ACP methyl ester carboxylesterase
LGWVVLGLVLAVYVGLPVAMAIAAVILAHGAGGSREGMRGTARMLAAHGYGVLALDLRGHGESGGRTNRLGWQGTEDVRAAVNFLDRQDDVQRIGALGSSLGGEVLLGASGTCPSIGNERPLDASDGCPQIRAIVADGATRRSTAELLALPSERPLVRSFTARAMYAAVRLLTWHDPPPPLLGEMQRAGATSFLLIAAGENELETSFNQLFARTLGEPGDALGRPGCAAHGRLRAVSGGVRAPRARVPGRAPVARRVGARSRRPGARLRIS